MCIFLLGVFGFFSTIMRQLQIYMYFKKAFSVIVKAYQWQRTSSESSLASYITVLLRRKLIIEHYFTMLYLKLAMYFYTRKITLDIGNKVGYHTSHEMVANQFCESYWGVVQR